MVHLLRLDVPTRSVQVFVVNASGDVILQRRNPFKDVAPVRMNLVLVLVECALGVVSAFKRGVGTSRGQDDRPDYFSKASRWSARNSDTVGCSFGLVDSSVMVGFVHRCRLQTRIEGDPTLPRIPICLDSFALPPSIFIFAFRELGT